MSEELIQRDLINNPEKIGKWDYYNIGATSIKSLKEYGIIPKIDYRELENKKIDGLIALKKKVIAVIEHKQPREFNTEKKKQKAIKQEIEVAKALLSKLFIVTDSIDTLWVNALTGELILDENDEPIKLVFNSKSEEVVKLIEKIHNSIDANNSKIIPPKLTDPTGLAKQIWQDIWSVSGATPENCLYTFIELFIFKYISDLGILTSTESFDFLLNLYKEKTDEEVLEYYADRIRKKIKELFPKNTTDNTTIINGTIFVSKDDKAVGGYSSVFKKILQNFQKEGKLENIHKEFKSRVFESFLKESISKKNWGQFFTPLKVVRAIVQMSKSEIKENIKICDPACGVGKFLLEAVADDINRFYKIENNTLVNKIDLIGYDRGFDHEEQKTIILAKANMLIYFSDLIKQQSSITSQFSNLFNKTFFLHTKNILGTLRNKENNIYDLILTNPPYVTSGSSNLKDEIIRCGLSDFYKVNALGVEGLFMEWIIRALKPGGKAFIVVPDGIFNRQYDKNLRSFILEECFIDAIISLPLNTFFTTNKKTYILCLTKKIDKSVSQTDPVFTYLVSAIGESLDVYRFETDDNDLEQAVILYNQFKGAKSYFRSEDKRCKIIGIDFFISNLEQHWLVDKNWTDEELIELGIKEEEKILTFNEFAIMLEDIATTINDFKSDIKELEVKKKSLMKLKEFSLPDLFEFNRGYSKYTKSYGNKYKGNYPVYSASNNSPLTYINSFDYDGEFLTWATNGFAGYVTILNGKFSLNGDRGILIPKNQNIDNQFLKIVLEPKLRKIAKGRKGEKGEDEFTKVYPSMLDNVKCLFPIDENDQISLEGQKLILDNFLIVKALKDSVFKYHSIIKDLIIITEYLDNQTKEISISDIFDIQKGNSKYTKKYLKKHKGSYPVYSSQTKSDGVIGSIDSFDFDLECITWTTDGVHAGTVFLRNGKFSMTTHCGALILKSKFIDKIDLEFISQYLSRILKKYAQGDSNKRVTVNIIKNIKINIPISEPNEFDITSQKEIAEKNRTVSQVKSFILDELIKIYNSNINILEY